MNEITNEMTVAPSGSIAEALRSAAPNTRIVLKKGIYREKLEISVPGIEIAGESPEETVIVYGDYANKLDEQGREYVTFRTYTAAVLAPDVVLRGITVENDALFPEKKGQEVALTVYADGFLAENCRFISTQDTVFCGPLPPDLIERYDGFLKDELRREGSQRHIFRDCCIAGTVDFIFGCGDSLFDNCEIVSLYDVRGCGYVAAPAHSKEQETGFVFLNCRFSCDERVESGSIYLARPWRDYGKASFIGCEYGRHISPGGFDKWNDTGRDRTARFYEYGKTPDGSVPEGRVPWARRLTKSEAEALPACFGQNSAR